jgi:hypothetical protein
MLLTKELIQKETLNPQINEKVLFNNLLIKILNTKNNFASIDLSYLDTFKAIDLATNLSTQLFIDSINISVEFIMPNIQAKKTFETFNVNSNTKGALKSKKSFMNYVI